MTLFDTIISEQNIYNAIYCLESYVFEKGLLDKDDLQRYVTLRDKFNFENISKTIDDCRAKLVELLKDNPNELFDVKVYFKIKKLDVGKDGEPDKIKYRPLHTASLIDQICMVCMLLPLMFDDSTGIRKRSELTKMIPHNFYGNIPSCRVETLFKPWIKQYKSYTDNIIEHCKEYKNNHRYNTEVTLDIKNFFPSISPEFIFKYVRDKLSYTFQNNDDKAMLDLVLTKLLIFNISMENLTGWEEEYYGDSIHDSKSGFYSRGIAQGLPQSYLWGNLCMIEIRKKLMQIDDFKDCDAYFYVDDSVIYISKGYNTDLFNETIIKLNDAISKIGESVDDETQLIYKRLLTEDQYRFQNDIEYKIQFHDSNKSEFCRIENADMSIAGLDPLMRNVSMASAIFGNADENEDSYSEDKLKNVNTLIEDEIARIEIEKNNGNDSDKQSKAEARLKLLKRYRRFYLYRLRLLNHRLSDEITDKQIDDFKLRYKIFCKSDECKMEECRKKAWYSWFDSFDEEIFQSETRMLITMLPLHRAKIFLKSIQEFELWLTDGKCRNVEYLFFSQDFETTLRLKGLYCNPYTSISRIVRNHISPIRSFSPSRQKRNFERFAKSLVKYKQSILNKGETDSIAGEEILNGYANFIFANSDEYSRIILNAFYSVQNEIEPSDARTFTKYSSRGLHYTELRILTRLRNKEFDTKRFVRALDDIDATDLDNRMSIDMGLLEVVNIFISKVRNPECIDNIILTHRVLKGLWYNGSKFMNSYTLHNEEHAITLIKAVVKLVKAIDFLNIKQTDYYIIFLACYLHDVSMVIHPNINSFCNDSHGSHSIISDFITDTLKVLNEDLPKNPDVRESTDAKFKKVGHLLINQFELIYNYFSDTIRSDHPKDSANMIRSWKDTVLKHLSPILLSHVAKISESHGYDAAEVYGVKSDARSSLFSEKYSMILIRLADLMDVANDRINYNLLRQNVSHMAPASQFHWISHLITDEIQLSPTYHIKDNKDIAIGKRKIFECLNFNLFINVKFLETTKKHCKECHMVNPLNKTIVNLPVEYSDCEGMMLEMFPSNALQGKDKPCPVLCRWIIKKHEWFINELKQLNHYLNAVNDRWFTTQIRFNIIYRDDFPLDRDLYDAVYEFIIKD